MAAEAEHLVRRTREAATLRPSVVVYVALVAGIIALFPTWLSLAKLWRESADYQHGFLLVAIVVYWLVHLRARIDSVPNAVPYRLAMLPLALGLVGWMIASRANSELMQQLLIPIIALTSVLATMGRRVARFAAPPLLFLYYVIPIWDHLVPVLQGMTTWAAELVLALLNVPTVVEGNDVSIPAGRFTIADACSGKRYLIVGLAFATLLGTLQGLRRGRLVALLAATVAVALVINWLRVVTIIYAGHVSDMQHYLVATEHLTFGWLVFIPLLAIVMFVAKRLGRHADSSARREVAPRVAVATGGENVDGVHVSAASPLLLFVLPPMLMPGCT